VRFAFWCGHRQNPTDAAPTVPRDRLRGSVPCASDRGPGPGQSNGPGLPVLPSSRFWGILAPFTPDDDLFGTFWPERGRWSVADVELIPALRLSDELRFSTSRNAIAHDDPGINPHVGLWFALHPTPGIWRVLYLSDP
jgi:hypothetical protein